MKIRSIPILAVVYFAKYFSDVGVFARFSDKIICVFEFFLFYVFLPCGDGYVNASNCSNCDDDIADVVDADAHNIPLSYVLSL